MKENSDGNDTNVGSIGNSIEEDIAKVNTYIELVLEKDYCNCNELNTILGEHCDGSRNVAYAMQHILSAYRRVLKENEKLRVKWDKDTHILQNKLDYANADRIDLAQQNKGLRKENEELNNRCRNLDKEAQAYLEELAGDNTLTRRTIKQLQEENEECKLDVQDYLKQAQENAEMYRKAQKKIQDLKAENEELKKDYYNVINKIENKIDILDIAISECIYIDDDDKAYKKAVKKDKLCLLNQKRALQELLEGGQS